MNNNSYISTDFGDVKIPEGGWPVKHVNETYYSEYTGRPYHVRVPVMDTNGPLGQQWAAYEKHIFKLAEAAYNRGDQVGEIVAPSFSEFCHERRG